MKTIFYYKLQHYVNGNYETLWSSCCIAEVVRYSIIWMNLRINYDRTSYHLNRYGEYYFSRLKDVWRYRIIKTKSLF